MEVRRVVTGHDGQGRAAVVSDEWVTPVTATLVPGWEWHQLWGTDQRASYPDDGSRPVTPLYFPPAEGSRFAFFTIPPGQAAVPPDLDVAAAIAEFQQRLPGLGEYIEPDDPGMHTTASIDYGVVISGEATMELDDGATVTLRPGDTYVQNGTRHRWHNHGEVPAVVAVALIGADHAKELTWPAPGSAG